MNKTVVNIALSALTALAAAASPTQEEAALARRNAERAMAIMDATWKKAAINKYRMPATETDLAIADVIGVETGDVSGPSDVWPYTAAIEAHNSLLEALNALGKINEENMVWASGVSKEYENRLNWLIDNLEWYRGSYNLTSYAVTTKSVSPYAVPRAGKRGTADVSGILNVYDDQMWLARELIRAYRLTGIRDYLEKAVYLTDYVLEGWDCWHDADGKEYGGITWGPGYNSKHACSNAPIIQPLVWLAEIYGELEEKGELTEAEKGFKFYDRDETNRVFVDKTTPRSKHYLDFAKKVYSWQKENLLDPVKGVYSDMMGADNTIVVSGGYRRHVDTGGATGSFFSYNTGTMISGAAELYRVTHDTSYLEDLDATVRQSFAQFARSVRSKRTYEFKTDDSALNGFNTWFNNVLIRSYVDALPYCGNQYAADGIKYMQKNLDYAFENPDFNKGNLLPVLLLDGWEGDVKTKPFHQFSFASEYGVIAASMVGAAGEESGVNSSAICHEEKTRGGVYSITGMHLGEYETVRDRLPKGLYIVGGKKLVLGK